MSVPLPHVPQPSGSTEYVLTISCPDRPGLVADVTRYIFESGGNIVESQQFEDRLTAGFFMRVHFETVSGDLGLDELRTAFAPIGARHAMTWQMWNARDPYRTLIMVSKLGHCLNDLLFRWSTGSLNIVVPAVVSNHTDLAPLAAAYGIPFHHIPVTPDTKQQAEGRLRELVGELGIHLVVLARYMQVLSDDLALSLPGRIINIHHSFLPSFKGVRPYHQAFTRGVKLVGATAHFVTPELDEGPIIEQDVLRVDHRLGPEELVTAGQEIESRVLTRAVRWRTDNRVLLNGDRTVVFS
ncbi:MAG TPA: formyltetrahydrofolate deformylase [Lapillicoccus sp.]|nr:formyltetrahydrofolate deformylase [Lapillicoccus sp.]